MSTPTDSRSSPRAPSRVPGPQPDIQHAPMTLDQISDRSNLRRCHLLCTPRPRDRPRRSGRAESSCSRMARSPWLAAGRYPTSTVAVFLSANLLSVLVFVLTPAQARQQYSRLPDSAATRMESFPLVGRSICGSARPS